MNGVDALRVDAAPGTGLAGGRRVLLLGAGGMLGRAWREALTARKQDHLACTHFALDITDHKAIDHTLDKTFGLVINCAAQTDVDGAEVDSLTAYEINGLAPGELARRCATVGAKLVHYSTDYVFDGASREPYLPADKTSPVNLYGASKELGERLIREGGCSYLIIRTSWLFAGWGHNFVLRMGQRLREGVTLQAPTDQVSRPTEATDLVGMSLGLLEADATGIWHAAGGEACTRYAWLSSIAAAAGVPADRVRPCLAEVFKAPARRPSYSVLDLSATESLIGPAPDWRAGVRRALSDEV